MRTGVLYSNSNQLDSISLTLEQIASTTGAKKRDSIDAIRLILTDILSCSFNTEKYLVAAIADRSTQDIELEQKLIQSWHNIGIRIYYLGTEHAELKHLAEEASVFASNWVSPAIWSAGANMKSLETTRRLAQRARELLREL